ncbi:MAG: AraC family transcriptional regulator [Parvibaculaceae bacterium]
MTKAQEDDSPGCDELAPPIAGVTPEVDMGGVYFMRASPVPPFRLVLPAGNFSYGLMVQAGTFRLHVEFPLPEDIILRPGDVVGISGLTPHYLESEDSGLRTKIDTLDMVEMTERGVVDDPIRMIVGVAPQETIALSNMIVGPIYVPFDEAEEHNKRIWHALQLLEDEAAMPGTDFHHPLIVRRIAEIVSLNMTRSLLTRRGAEEHSSVGYAASKAIMRALRAFMNEPYEAWTVERMATAAGMSRTRFAEEFRRLIGQPPIETISRIRLTMIARKMMANSLSVEEAAFQAGYSSSAAFVRSFRKRFGMSPARWRKNQIEKENEIN